MNEKERLILKLIQDDPFISQNELAEKLNLSRPAVANYISSLMKKGEIIGRAYVLREDDSVVCIGGANVDRKIMLKDPYKWIHRTRLPPTKRWGELLGILLKTWAGLALKRHFLPLWAMIWMASG